MNLIEKATIRHYHHHRIAAYQNGTVEALGWKAEASQVKRFEVLATVGNLDGCTLLDVGCGYGDLKGYLDQIYSDFTYIGFDQMPEFISEAKKRYGGCPATYFFQTDFSAVDFPKVDYVIASGAFGYRCQNPDFYFEMIRKMYTVAGRAAAFNMLDAACFPEDDLLIGHDLDRVVAFCDLLSRRVEVISGYLEDDFTVFMHKESNQESVMQ
jgi:cyclopropane fatty-acyl-phospholipid synthase-like methyltransferase